MDPGTSAYNPRPLIKYMAALGVPYIYEEQPIIDVAGTIDGLKSICSFCSRMKRVRRAPAVPHCCACRSLWCDGTGRHVSLRAQAWLQCPGVGSASRRSLRVLLYVIDAQRHSPHDEGASCGESPSPWASPCNPGWRSQANYTVTEGDLRVIRPFVFTRERQLREFAESAGVRLPVIAENCPACFAVPKERHRTKQLLAAQELLIPELYATLKKAIIPLMAISGVGEANKPAWLRREAKANGTKRA